MRRIICKKPSRLYLRILVMVCCCIVVPLAMLTFYVRNYMTNILQHELSKRIIQTISKNESYIYDSLQKLAYYSGTFIYDSEFRNRIAQKDTSFFKNEKYFDRMVSAAEFQNPDSIISSAKVTVFDNYGRVYSNWSMNYQNYDFLLQEPWVKEALNSNGHVVWSIFQPAYIYEESDKNIKYISLARSILSDVSGGETIGTLIISIDQKEIGNILTEYSYAGDKVYVVLDDGEVLMELDDSDSVSDEQLKEIYDKTRGINNGETKTLVDGEKYLISYYAINEPWTFSDQQMKVYHFSDYSAVEEQVKTLADRINRIIGAVLIMILVVCLVIARIIVKPIRQLTDEMEKYDIGNKMPDVNVTRNDEIGQLNRAFVNMADRIHSLFEQLKEENRIKEQYHYDSLRSQLNPHFLFNTLNTIRWMAIIRNANNIVDAIDSLAGILKYSMSRESGLVSVSDEIENTRNFIYIHNLRYQDSISLECTVKPDILDLKVLKFILQPIVENAIIHGRDGDDCKPMVIRISGEIRNGTLLIVVEDNGIGISDKTIQDFINHKEENIKSSKMTGIGITNVDAIIRLKFGESYGLELSNTSEHGARITYVLPVIEGETNEEADDSR